jgi:hypothetical protein
VTGDLVMRLRGRIDQLTDERDQAIAALQETRDELQGIRNDIKAAKDQATRASKPDKDGTRAWLAEYDRRKAARRERRRRVTA